MSLRAVGEGHISSIEFRTGTVGPAGAVRLDAPGKFPECGNYSPGPYSRELFHAKLAERGCDNQAASQVLDHLGPVFGPAELDSALEALHPDLLSRATVREAVRGIRWVAANNYTVEFPAETEIAERVLWPHGPTELQGMEDARFVRFVENDGTVKIASVQGAAGREAQRRIELITADVEVIPIQRINEAYERMLKSDVKYRFSIDMASLKS